LAIVGVIGALVQPAGLVRGGNVRVGVGAPKDIDASKVLLIRDFAWACAQRGRCDRPKAELQEAHRERQWADSGQGFATRKQICRQA
jgi:hypothetical protein